METPSIKNRGKWQKSTIKAAMKPCGAPDRKRQGWMAEDQMKNENTGNGVAGMVMPFFVYEKSWVGRGMIYALSDFLIMIVSWLVKQSLRAFLFQEVKL